MYSVVQCVNGNYSVVAEGLDESGAKKAFWNRCTVLENAPDVIRGQVAILNEYLQVVNGFTQAFTHEQPEPEVVPEEPVEDENP